jgi:hypothetical protein
MQRQTGGFPAESMSRLQLSSMLEIFSMLGARRLPLRAMDSASDQARCTAL